MEEDKITLEVTKKEAELISNALQNQANGLINKIQSQFVEQSKQEEDEILVEEENGSKGN